MIELGVDVRHHAILSRLGGRRSWHRKMACTGCVVLDRRTMSRTRESGREHRRLARHVASFGGYDLVGMEDVSMVITGASLV